MALATLLVAIGAAAFTAVAALAAWRAASLAGSDARERAKPFIAVALPRCDVEANAVIVPMKNLGLGPARSISIQVKRPDGKVAGIRLAPGLAPMESESWPVFIIDGAPMLDPTGINVEGTVEDALGRKHQLHLFGQFPLEPMNARGWPDEGETLPDAD